MRYLAEILLAALFSADPTLQLNATAQPTLSDLLIALPADIRSNHFDFAHFSDAVTAKCETDPGSFLTSVPAIEHDLNDSDSKVRFYTMSVLFGLTMQTGDRRPVLTLQKKLESMSLSDDENNCVFALTVLTDPKVVVSDDYAHSLEREIQEKSLPPRLLLASGGLLMAIRPTDPAAQEALIAAITDADRPRDTRCQLLNAASSELVGTRFTEFVITTVNSSADKSVRDCAISGAERIGPRAVVPLRDTLRKIAHDAGEQPKSRDIALSAVSRLQ